MEAHRSLFVVWQDSESRRWHPVGRLMRDRGSYVFNYTNGAADTSNFKPFGNMKDLIQTYRAKTLFPLFANRVLSRSRPEFAKMMVWHGLDPSNDDEFELLARSGGRRATDSVALVSEPERTADNKYVVHFFSHGIRYLPEEAQNRATSLAIGERLFPMWDFQNTADTHAVQLRTDDPMAPVGYLPRYLSEDLIKLFVEFSSTERAHLKVARVNRDAPAQLKLLVRFTAPWPAGFKPFDYYDFQPISSGSSSSSEERITATG